MVVPVVRRRCVAAAMTASVTSSASVTVFRGEVAVCLSTAPRLCLGTKSAATVEGEIETTRISGPGTRARGIPFIGVLPPSGPSLRIGTQADTALGPACPSVRGAVGQGGHARPAMPAQPGHADASGQKHGQGEDEDKIGGQDRAQSQRQHGDQNG